MNPAIGVLARSPGARRGAQTAVSAWAGPAPTFETVLGRSAWTGSLGVLGIAAWLALWTFMAADVLVPLAHAVADFQASDAAVPAAIHDDAGAAPQQPPPSDLPRA